MSPRVSSSVRIPLSLVADSCWELEGRVDSTAFLQALPSAFPEATSAFFEGSSIAPDIVRIFEVHVDEGLYAPVPQTLWATDSILRFRCKFDRSLCVALADASLHNAEPELFDHIFIYADALALLEWPDAFANCMWIASSMPESRVVAFAAKLGLTYKYAVHS